MRTILVSAALLAAATPADAGIGSGKWIMAADAARMTDACLALAGRSGWKLHVAVMNGHGDLVRFVGMDGASRTSAVNAVAKARTVFRTNRSTRDAAKMDPSLQREFEVLALAGGLPVIVDGRLVGAIGVSGAQADEDEVCAKAAIDAAM